MSNQADQQALIEAMAGFRWDPLGHVLFSYPWGEHELANSQGPRAWQQAILETIGAHLQNDATRHQPLLIAVASGHGIGKSALISQIVKWSMDTHDDTKVVVTANTETQLRTKTWPEVAKWSRLAITSDWFQVTATSMASVDPAHELSWKATAVPWSETNTEAFAGAHNKGKRLVLIMDEASSIPDKIWEVLEGALTDEETEIIWIAFGNPTRNTGRFRECFRRWRHRWKTWQIDSRDVEGTNKAQIDKWVQDYGVDSDFVKVRVRGIFPAMSSRQFISEADVDAATTRVMKPHQYEWAPVILSLDPAWGGDDELVIGKRQGLVFQVLWTCPKNDNDVVVANVLAKLEDEHHADGVFVDGGYGTGVVSVGRTLGRDWTIVWFGGESTDAGCLNKRAQMWNDGKKWLKEGGCLPADDQVLRNDILSPEVVPRMDGKIQLEAKEDMKERGLPSPNRGDAWALTFAFPVRRRETVRPAAQRTEHADPFAKLRRRT